jgi:hypothetical protein
VGKNDRLLPERRKGQQKKNQNKETSDRHKKPGSADTEPGLSNILG